MAPVRVVFAVASLVMLPSLTVGLTVGQLPNQQFASPQLPYAQNLIGSPQQLQMDSAQIPYAQGLMGLSQQTASTEIPYASLISSPRQPASPPIPYGQSLIESSFPAQQYINPNPAMLYARSPTLSQASILALQAQLATQHTNEVQLQEEMLRMSRSQPEAGADEEQKLQELQKQLANTTAVNDRLHVELTQAQDEETQKAKDLFDAQEQVSILQDKLRAADQSAKEYAKQNQDMKNLQMAQESEQRAEKSQALRVMKEVQMAQERVKRTEEILRSLLPRMPAAVKSGAVDASNVGSPGTEQVQ